MSSLSRRLIASYLLIILIGMGIAAPLAWLALERSYVETQRANLLAQAELVARTLESAELSQPVGEPYGQYANLAPGVHTRVLELPDHSEDRAQTQDLGMLPRFYTRLIGQDDAVVIGLAPSSGVEQKVVAPLPALAQNAQGTLSAQELLDRVEVAGAFEGVPSTAIRSFPDQERRVLYAAAPVRSGGAILRIVYLASPLPASGWAGLSSEVRWQLAVVLLLGVTLAGLAGWRFARAITRPIRQLAFAAEGVAGGDLAQHVPSDSSIADLRALGEAFNTMTESLRRADQARTTFVADVSHELRTPLTVIKGTVETLQSGAIDDLEARGGFLDSIAGETERLIMLVNDLLVLTRADAGALKLQLEPLNMVDLARSRVSRLARVAGKTSLSVHVETREEVPRVKADGDLCVLADQHRLAQVFDNLLDNAIRYSPPGAQVRVTLSRQGDEVRCAVSDDGPGIAERHLPQIFDRFYRVESSRSRRLGGSGLGLAISRAIVQAHRGSISAESVEGHGTTISFCLPATTNCS